MSNTSNLYHLQQIDSGLDKAHIRISEIDQILNDDSSILAAASEANQATTVYRESLKSMREIEYLVTEQRTKIEQNETSLYSGKIKNPKELQDLQNEVASLKRYLNVLEDRQLDAMISTEEQEEKMNKLQQATDQVRGRFEEQNAHLRAEKTKLLNNIDRLEVERKAAEGSISEDDLNLYQQLRYTRNGIAVAKITERSCSACGSSLSARILQSASSQIKIVRCPSCNRILFSG